MTSTAALRLQIETALAHRIPSALTPAPRVIRPVAPTGIAQVDALLEGGLPVGAITEMTGVESSGRTSLALSFLAGLTRTENVVAWIDIQNAFDPESAAAAGVDLSRLLWVRCGVDGTKAEAAEEYRFALPRKYFTPAPEIKGLHGAGRGDHPRNEVKGLAAAVAGMLRTEAIVPRCAEPQRKVRPQRETFRPTLPQGASQSRPTPPNGKPWARIEQGLRVADLLLQAGGFRVLVLDMAGIAPEYAVRVPLATWFRYRAAAERTSACLLLLTQHPCAKSSRELLLRFGPGEARGDESTVLSGMDYRLEVERRRFLQADANMLSHRKPPQRANTAWHAQSSWAGVR